MEGILLLLFLSFVSFIAFVWNLIRWKKDKESKSENKDKMVSFLVISIALFLIAYFLLAKFASGMAL